MISGEMTAMLGLSMIFHYFYITDSVVSSNWYYLYAMSQGTVAIALLFCMTNSVFLILYVISAVASLIMAVATSYAYPTNLAIYAGIVGLLDLCKVGFMVSYWRHFVNCRCHSRFDRLHIWEN